MSWGRGRVRAWIQTRRLALLFGDAVPWFRGTGDTFYRVRGWLHTPCAAFTEGAQVGTMAGWGRQVTVGGSPLYTSPPEGLWTDPTNTSNSKSRGQASASSPCPPKASCRLSPSCPPVTPLQHDGPMPREESD